METLRDNEATATHPSRTFDFNDHSPIGNKSVSLASLSSPSSSHSLDEHFNPLIDNKANDAKVAKGSPTANSSYGHLNPFRDGTDLPTSTFPTTEASSSLPSATLQMNVSATQSPTVQIMERPRDDVSSYRIPDYVFQRNKSRVPKEWSTASNESLFSIQMGQTSFAGDLFVYSKSGELGMRKSEELSMHRKSGKLASLKSNKSTDFGQNCSSGELGYSKSVDLGWYNLSGELSTLRQKTSKSEKIMYSNVNLQPQVNVLNSPSSNDLQVPHGFHRGEHPETGQGVGYTAETKKDVIMENEKNHNLIESPSLAFGLNNPAAASSLDQRSSSTKSFTFPVLMNTDKSPSSSNRSVIKPNVQEPHPVQQPQTPPSANTTSATTSTTPTQTRSSLFSCFCCPLRI